MEVTKTLEVIVSQMRWPPNVYREIKRQAKEKGVSVNTMVADTMARVLEIGKKENEEK